MIDHKVIESANYCCFRLIRTIMTVALLPRFFVIRNQFINCFEIIVTICNATRILGSEISNSINLKAQIFIINIMKIIHPVVEGRVINL